MPFDLRCPECRTKLRLDARPAPDAEVECPKCGGTFTPAESAAADKPAAGPKPAKPKGLKGAKEDAAKAPMGEVKEGTKRTFMNPLLLLGILGVGMVVYLLAAGLVLHLLGKAGRVEDMIAYLPADVTVARGVNLQMMNKYPGYKTELDKYAPPPVRSALDGLAAAGGVEKDAFLDYLVVGRVRGPGAGRVFVFRSRADLDAAALTAGLGGTADPAGGPGAVRLPATAPGVLAGALMVVIVETRRHVVVVPPSAGQAALLQASLAAAGDRTRSFIPHLGDIGRLAMRGHAWLVVRAPAGGTPPLAAEGEKVAKDLPVLSKEAKEAPVAAMWTSFGGRVRIGAGFDSPSSTAATAVVKAMKDGPLGKADDSEIPREVKTAITWTFGKEFKEFLLNISYRSSGTAMYMTTSMGGTNGMRILNGINLPGLADGGSDKP